MKEKAFLGRLGLTAGVMGLALSLSTVPHISAYASEYMPDDYDMTYEGTLDSTGGIPANGGTGGSGGLDGSSQTIYSYDPSEGQVDESGDLVLSGTDSSVVMLTSDMGYDTEMRMYVNYIRGSREKYYYSSIPRDIFFNGPASFNLGTRSQYALYRNGERVSEPDLNNITEEGAYVLETYEQNGTDAERFQFTILGSSTNTMEEFTIPEGFSFVSIQVGADMATTPYGRTFYMASDTRYIFSFECPQTGDFYQVALNKDTVAPILAFEGLAGELARGPVTVIRASDEESTITVLLDDKEINLPYNMVLDEYGRYVVTARDAAGNVSEYHFTIQMYFTMTSFLVFALLAAVVAGLYGYFKYTKKHLRVR